ncbi:MAG: DUF4440 domain-containing protein [Bacillota bacterium]
MDSTSLIPHDLSCALQRYQRAWESALKNNDVAPLEYFISSDYKNCFGHMDMEQFGLVDREETLQGLRRFISILSGATHLVQHLSIHMRSSSDAVVSYLRVVARHDDVTASVVVVQTWRRLGDSWQITREFAEALTR